MRLVLLVPVPGAVLRRVVCDIDLAALDRDCACDLAAELLREDLAALPGELAAGKGFPRA